MSIELIIEQDSLSCEKYDLMLQRAVREARTDELAVILSETQDRVATLEETVNQLLDGVETQENIINQLLWAREQKS